MATANGSVRLAILENRVPVRENLAWAFAQAGILVACQTASPEVFLGEISRTQSAIAIVQFHVCGKDTPRLLQNALVIRPGLKSIVLTFDATAKEAEQCMRAGAFGCVARVICPFELVGMVRAATYQEQTISLPSCSIPLVAVASTLLDALSAREYQVLQYIAVGADNLKISAHLEISERTVKAHVHAIYQKLGFENRTQLALFALKRGIPPVEEV
jgi:two-component system nitrate/nitrite response regulator NarP